MVFRKSKYNSNIQNVFYYCPTTVASYSPQVNFFDIMLKREGQTETEVAAFKS